MVEEAYSIGADTCQYFSRNPRGGAVKPFDEADVKAAVAFMKEHDIGRILTHAPYVLNPSAATEELRNYTIETMRSDVERLEHFPEAMYNFHPGAHVSQGEDAAIGFISHLLNEVITPGQKTVMLLETMAGKGTEMGKTFEELARIIEKTDHPESVGVCLDTCHVWDGGYDIRDHLEEVLSSFDRIVGLEKLLAIHFNDSKNPLGAHKDRHEKIGEGYLGIGTFEAFLNHPALKDLGFYLETPNDVEGYRKEIALLRSLVR